MPPKKKEDAKGRNKKDKKDEEEVEEVEVKTKAKAKSKTSKAITPAKRPKQSEKKKEKSEGDDSDGGESIKNYSKYLKKTWLLRIPIAYNDQLLDDGYYYNVQTGTVVQLSDIIKLTSKEAENLDKITENKKEDNSTNKSIRKKLDSQGYGIISYARIIGDKDYIDNLKEAINEKKAIERFEIKPKKTLEVKQKKKSTKLITPAKRDKATTVTANNKKQKGVEESEEEQQETQLDAIFERNVDEVIERLETASDDNSICIDVINAVESCADTKKSIKKIKLSKKEALPNVEFTYPAKTDYETEELKELALRYITAFKEKQSKTKKKSKTKEPSKTDRSTLAQPRGGPTRTVGDKTVNSVARPGVITTTGIEAGETKKPVLRSLAVPELLKVVKEIRGKHLSNINYKPISTVKEETEGVEVSNEEEENVEEEDNSKKKKKKEKTTVRVRPLGKKTTVVEEEEEEEPAEEDEEQEEEEEEDVEQLDLGSDEEGEVDNTDDEDDHEDDEEEASEE